jgi:glycerol uptake facilitator-like aquaporin
MIVAGDFTSAWVYTLGSVIGGILTAMLYDRFVRQADAPGTEDL